MGTNLFDLQSLIAEHWFEAVINSAPRRKEQFGFAKVTDARRKPETDEGHQAKDVVGEARCVGVVLLNPQV